MNWRWDGAREERVWTIGTNHVPASDPQKAVTLHLLSTVGVSRSFSGRPVQEPLRAPPMGPPKDPLNALEMLDISLEDSQWGQ